jgi:hypothetical protein
MDFHLSRMLGCTVAELGDRMSALEYLHWSRFLAVEQQSKELSARRGGAG